jgi:hypothetical protein
MGYNSWNEDTDLVREVKGNFSETVNTGKRVHWKSRESWGIWAIEISHAKALFWRELAKASAVRMPRKMATNMAPKSSKEADKGHTVDLGQNPRAPGSH